MAFSAVMSAALSGLRGEMVQVEADVSNGLPMIHMVGYLSSEVREASERVRTAIRNSGMNLPPKRIVINLAPATMKKRGASFDLPIALAVLTALGAVPGEPLEGTLVLGELSLDGKVQRVAGVLPMVREAGKQGCHTCILPEANASEGALVENMKVIGVESLGAVLRHLLGEEKIPPAQGRDWHKAGNPLGSMSLDYSDIQGQKAAKRAAEVAVAGGHNLLLMGPPGSGKSMIAQRIPTILPPTSFEESMEITGIYSVRGMIEKERPLITGRPFRSVHHTATKAALVGGGAIPCPGEISLAHGGVLFLDELAEFSKPVLEVLRQPLEERQVQIGRSHGNYLFPAHFMLVAAMNPCPCGNYPDLGKCRCTEGQIHNYLGHLSQPFLDRLDVCIEVPQVCYEELSSSRQEEDSAAVRSRVIQAREIQNKRYKGRRFCCNATLSVKEMESFCGLGEKEERLMNRAFTALGLTARTYHKILRVARTIADLEGAEWIAERHLKEAIGYRALDKKYWGR